MPLLVVRNHFTMLQINSSDYKAHQQHPFHSAVPILSGIYLKRKLNEHTRTQVLQPLPQRELCQQDLNRKISFLLSALELKKKKQTHPRNSNPASFSITRYSKSWSLLQKAEKIQIKPNNWTWMYRRIKAKLLKINCNYDSILFNNYFHAVNIWKCSFHY